MPRAKKITPERPSCLFPSEVEIARLVMPEGSRLQWPAAATILQHRHGLVPVDPILGRRYWPAVRAFLDDRNRVAPDVQPMAMPDPAHLYVSRGQLPRLIILSAREGGWPLMLKQLEKQGFPNPDRSLGGWYWPAVRQFFDRRYRLDERVHRRGQMTIDEWMKAFKRWPVQPRLGRIEP